MNMEIRNIKLDNDFEVLYVDGLDGGGLNHLPDFLSVITNHGKDKYQNALEWCAGFGVIGFDFLNKGLCERMEFMDCYEPAIRWLNRTIEHNNVENKTATYHADKISLIPEGVKWDLVLANPPHSFDLSTKKYFEETVRTPQLDDIIRITCDVDLEIHREFFNNIRTYLEPGADIFISEVGFLDEVQQLAEDAGLLFVDKHPAPTLSRDSKTDAVIFHFKEPQ